jgi:aspartate racemase
MTETRAREAWGVVGGMGPLASAEFLKTIYECNPGGPEQDFPVVMLYSDPTFPDRTTAFLAGRSEGVLARLTEACERLLGMGATRLVFCCMTIHHLLPQLPPGLRGRVVSLLDLIYDELEQTDGRHLLVCSTGTRALRLFEQDPRWGRLKHRLVLPDEAEQHRIHHDLIYPIKQNPDARELLPILEALLGKYRTDSFVAGCSEVHLVAKQLAAPANGRGRYRCIDPLMTLARRISKECV